MLVQHIVTVGRVKSCLVENVDARNLRWYGTKLDGCPHPVLNERSFNLDVIQNKIEFLLCYFAAKY